MQNIGFSHLFLLSFVKITKFNLWNIKKYKYYKIIKYNFTNMKKKLQLLFSSRKKLFSNTEIQDIIKYTLYHLKGAFPSKTTKATSAPAATREIFFKESSAASSVS